MYDDHNSAVTKSHLADFVRQRIAYPLEIQVMTMKGRSYVVDEIQ